MCGTRKLSRITLFLLRSLWILCFCSPNAVTGHWWSLGLLSWNNFENNPAYVLSPQPMCQNLQGLSSSQTKLCQLYSDHMPIIGLGAQVGIEECKQQFKFRKWNCSTHYANSAVGLLVSVGTREAGFAHAISSAGLVHAIARACRTAHLSTCSCSRAQRPGRLHRDWIWGGCGDNLEYAFQFASGFIDAKEKEKNYPRHSQELARMLMNLHNNEAGRRALHALASIGCKCHGVSGSCSLKTCWQQLVPFSKAGQLLVTKYDTAVKVKLNKRGTKLRKTEAGNKRYSKTDLVYIEESPDYCHRNISVGSHGISGRQCNLRTEDDKGSCETLCCGRGYVVYVERVRKDCNCKFHWCCEIECEKCERQQTVAVCN